MKYQYVNTTIFNFTGNSLQVSNSSTPVVNLSSGDSIQFAFTIDADAPVTIEGWEKVPVKEADSEEVKILLDYIEDLEAELATERSLRLDG